MDMDRLQRHLREGNQDGNKVCLSYTHDVSLHEILLFLFFHPMTHQGHAILPNALVIPPGPPTAMAIPKPAPQPVRKVKI